MSELADLKALLSAYIEQRDNLAKRSQSPLYVAGDRPNSLQRIEQFNSMLKSYSGQLAGILPPLGIAELEALSELVNSRLGDVRARH